MHKQLCVSSDDVCVCVCVFGILARDVNPFTPKSAKFKAEEEIWNFILQNSQKQTAPHESTSQYLSYEWLTTRVSSTDLKVRTAFIDSRFDSGSERVKTLTLLFSLCHVHIYIKRTFKEPMELFEDCSMIVVMV